MSTSVGRESRFSTGGSSTSERPKGSGLVSSPSRLTRTCTGSPHEYMPSAGARSLLPVNSGTIVEKVLVPQPPPSGSTTSTWRSLSPPGWSS